MHKKHISAGLASLLVCAGVMVSWPNSSYAKTAVNLERDSVVYNREDSSAKPRFQYEPEEGVRVGYIVVGDDNSLLDDDTMGYIRRMLHTKFPGFRYPPDRLGKDIDGRPAYRMGRRNTGDSYILTEAHDVLALEFEKLENMYKRIPRRKISNDSTITESSNGASIGIGVGRANERASISSNGVIDGVLNGTSNVAGNSSSTGTRSDSNTGNTRDYTNSTTGNGTGDISLTGSANASGSAYVDNDIRSIGIDGGLQVGTRDVTRHDDIIEDYDSLGADNSYDFYSHLSTLPKEDYVQFARELEEDGLGGYDYLVMFNIHPIRTQVKQKFLGQSRWSDFRLSVRAIDVKTGKYIDRGEYLKRGYSGSGSFKVPLLGVNIGEGPSWRKAMRRAIIDAMIESFDNIPIGKYSICDNPYCVRRQDELRMERVFGRSHRHCVKHCHDNTICNDHMVSYQIDADLPESYVNNEKDPIFTRE